MQTVDDHPCLTGSGALLRPGNLAGSPTEQLIGFGIPTETVDPISQFEDIPDHDASPDRFQQKDRILKISHARAVKYRPVPDRRFHDIMTVALHQTATAKDIGGHRIDLG